MVHAQPRNTWLDLAKGVAIILVVIGHSASFDVSPIYWFHMPAFFMMSGYFFRPQTNLHSIKSWIKKRARQLFIPYLFFLLLISAIRYIVLVSQSEMTLTWLVEDLVSIVVGGRFFPSDFYVVMWFIPCLFFTQLLGVLTFYFFKKKSSRICILLLFYVLAHLENWLTYEFNIFVPLNLDVAMLALPYYMLGYFVRRVMKKMNFMKLVIVGLLSTGVLLFNITRPIAYILDMRSVTYHHFFLDFVTPFALTVLLFISCALLSKTGRLVGWLTSIGQSSLIIMYTHVPIKIVLEQLLKANNLMIVLAGILLPLLFSKWIVEKNDYLSFLILGKPSPRIRPESDLRIGNTKLTR
jgi:fucose 4-O-acetylase-like acetyltransferase